VRRHLHSILRRLTDAKHRDHIVVFAYYHRRQSCQYYDVCVCGLAYATVFCHHQIDAARCRIHLCSLIVVWAICAFGW
jgi:hypothetical protein